MPAVGELGIDEASRAASWAGLPLRTPEDGLDRSRLSWSPLKESHRASINEHAWWATTYPGTIDDRCRLLLPLRDLLLSFGGEEACLPAMEEDLDRIMGRGQFWYGSPHQLMPGSTSHCHANSASLWDENRGELLLATGYALSDDGLWRQHSWCIRLTPQGGLPVETTVSRIAYFGFVLAAPEAENFLDENW